jgi:hypothetical protein
MFFGELQGIQNTNKNPEYEILIISNDQNYTNKFISRTTCLSFPLAPCEALLLSGQAAMTQIDTRVLVMVFLVKQFDELKDRRL